MLSRSHSPGRCNQSHLCLSPQTPEQVAQLILSQSYTIPSLKVCCGGCSFSHICIDPTTLQGGIHAGEAAVLQTLGTFVAPPTSDIYGEAGLAANGIEPYVPALQN